MLLLSSMRRSTAEDALSNRGEEETAVMKYVRSRWENERRASGECSAWIESVASDSWVADVGVLAGDMARLNSRTICGPWRVERGRRLARVVPICRYIVVDEGIDGSHDLAKHLFRPRAIVVFAIIVDGETILQKPTESTQHPEILDSKCQKRRIQALQTLYPYIVYAPPASGKCRLSGRSSFTVSVVR